MTVTVDPHVQPSAPPCPVFSLGTENPVELPAGSIWVVRMPYPLSKSSYVLVAFQIIHVCNYIKDIGLQPMVKSR